MQTIIALNAFCLVLFFALYLNLMYIEEQTTKQTTVIKVLLNWQTAFLLASYGILLILYVFMALFIHINLRKLYPQILQLRKVEGTCSLIVS